MPGPLLPVLALFGGLAYLDKSKKDALAREAVGRPPLWTPEAVSAIAVTWRQIRVMRDEMRPYMLASFAAMGLEDVTVEGAPGPVFRLVPLVKGELRASDVILQVKERGGVVLCSLTCALIGAPEDKLVCFGPPGCEPVASPLSHFALLWPTRAMIAAQQEAESVAARAPADSVDDSAPADVVRPLEAKPGPAAGPDGATPTHGEIPAPSGSAPATANGVAKHEAPPVLVTNVVTHG